LRAGDLLINVASDNAGHVVIFDRWTDATMTSYVGHEQSGDGGTHHRVIPYPYFGGWVPNLEAATTRAVELGASLLRKNETWHTLADPAGRRRAAAGTPAIRRTSTSLGKRGQPHARMTRPCLVRLIFLRPGRFRRRRSR
jgi:hypothetical protein